MSKELRSYFEQLKECSLNIVDIVEKEDYDTLQDKMCERQEIIDSISKLTFIKEEANSILKELGIQDLSEKIISLLNEKKTFLKEQLQENAVKQNANNTYAKNVYNNIHVFSKKV